MNCTQCGQMLDRDAQFCGFCGAPASSLASRFAQIEEQFAALQSRYHAGQIGEEAYDAQLRELIITDDQGGAWMLGADSGDWYRFDGQLWVLETPPFTAVHTLPPPPETAASQAKSPGKRRPRWFWILAASLVLAIGGVALLAVFTPYPMLAYHSLAIMVDPENPYHYWDRAGDYIELGNFEAAVEDMTAVINLEPTSYAYQLRGHYHQELGDMPRAQADLTYAIFLDPNDPYLYNFRSLFYRDINDLESAFEDTDMALSLDPGDCYFTFGRGELYALDLQFDQARQDFQYVLQNSTPDCRMWHEHVNRALARLPVE